MITNILVVDDDKDFLNMVQMLLEVRGYSVVTALNAHDGLDCLEKEVFALVLSDANMPEISGFDLVRTIRHQKKWNQVIVALLTGRRDKKDVELAIECGADDYIIKPIEPELFIAKVQSLLQKKGSAEAPEINFIESPVNMTARWEVKTEIARISELGMVLYSPISMAPNTKMKVESQLFKKIQIETPHLRVVSCEAVSGVAHMFFTKVSFVGITEQERQKIRFWINSNIPLFQKKVA